MRDIRLPLTATVDVVPSAPPAMRFIIAPIMPSSLKEDFSVVLTSARRAGADKRGSKQQGGTGAGARFMVPPERQSLVILIGPSDAAAIASQAE